jgi:hypothetical protein
MYLKNCLKYLIKYKLGSYLLKNAVQQQPCTKCGSPNTDKLLEVLKEFIRKKEIEKAIKDLRSKPKVRRR